VIYKSNLNLCNRRTAVAARATTRGDCVVAYRLDVSLASLLNYGPKSLEPSSY